MSPKPTHCSRISERGRGARGRLGHGNGTNMLVSTRVDALRFGGAKIVMVSAGGYHSIAVTEEGEVYTWGSGVEGALGLNDEEH